MTHQMISTRKRVYIVTYDLSKSGQNYDSLTNLGKSEMIDRRTLMPYKKNMK